MIKVGINGFGRIGRLILRALFENYKGKIQVVGINDLGSIEANAHLIKYDSTHGTLNQDVKTSNDGFQIGDQNIKVFAERDPAKLPWRKINVDVVLECWVCVALNVYVLIAVAIVTALLLWRLKELLGCYLYSCFCRRCGGAV